MRRVDPITEAFGYGGGWGFQRNVETKKERDAFALLVRRLQQRNFARKWWRAATPEQKAKVRAYRDRWAAENKEKVRAIVRRAHAKKRKDLKFRASEAGVKRAKRAELTAQRRRELVYTCVVCDAQWCRAFGRIPARAPKYCSQSCKSRANYRKAKQAGKPWVVRRLKCNVVCE